MRLSAKNKDILPFSIRCMHNCALRLNETMSQTHLKLIYLFRVWRSLAYKKSPKNI